MEFDFDEIRCHTPSGKRTRRVRLCIFMTHFCESQLLAFRVQASFSSDASDKSPSVGLYESGCFHPSPSRICCVFTHSQKLSRSAAGSQTCGRSRGPAASPVYPGTSGPFTATTGGTAPAATGAVTTAAVVTGGSTATGAIATNVAASATTAGTTATTTSTAATITSIATPTATVADTTADVVATASSPILLDVIRGRPAAQQATFTRRELGGNSPSLYREVLDRVATAAPPRLAQPGSTAHVPVGLRAKQSLKAQEVSIQLRQCVAYFHWHPNMGGGRNTHGCLQRTVAAFAGLQLSQVRGWFAKKANITKLVSGIGGITWEVMKPYLTEACRIDLENRLGANLLRFEVSSRLRY
eukprot:GHVU01086035.1.p1 GENE.GHVU01086035.1~~GHVU01086035.1.p1  ORF type:complete len:356 (+),score=21.67 GHVU01086035.1:238-1305(+)